ncbi:MAG: Crp/Fnr family transcriptional regulator [Prevotellaceae bacterium]|jgi:CRP-like cAMP-binding protein|nr:Crp/Fnr family transcriptional regulator [Prevotellaceae bacterium]
MKIKQKIDFEKILDSVFNILIGITEKDKEQIAANSSYIFLSKKKTVFKEGETPEHLICLVSGQVKIYKEGPAGRDCIMRMANSGEMLGYYALIADEKYNVSALTIEDSIICKIDRETVFNILKKNTKVMITIMRQMAKELYSLSSKTVTLTQKHIRGRFAETLLRLGESYGFEEDGKTIKIILSREDLANLSNMTTSNAIRTLSALNTEGLIEVDGRRIKLVDIAALEEISKIG